MCSSHSFYEIRSLFSLRNLILEHSLLVLLQDLALLPILVIASLAFLIDVIPAVWVVAVVIVKAAAVAWELLLPQMDVVEVAEHLVVLAIMAHFLEVDGILAIHSLDAQISWSMIFSFTTRHDYVWFQAWAKIEATTDPSPNS